MSSKKLSFPLFLKIAILVYPEANFAEWIKENFGKGGVDWKKLEVQLRWGFGGETVRELEITVWSVVAGELEDCSVEYSSWGWAMAVLGVASWKISGQS